MYPIAPHRPNNARELAAGRASRDSGTHERTAQVSAVDLALYFSTVKDDFLLEFNLKPQEYDESREKSKEFFLQRTSKIGPRHEMEVANNTLLTAPAHHKLGGYPVRKLCTV